MKLLTKNGRCKKVICLTIPLLVLSLHTYGQLNRADSLARNQAIYSAKQKYYKTLSGNALIFNGEEYVSPVKQKKVIGHPYFLDFDWQEGLVFYNDQLYENVSLRYDIYQDKLLIEYLQGYESIELITEKIKFFKVSEHIFVPLSSNQFNFKNGFYELLYTGETTVYAQRHMVIKEITDQDIMVVEYLERDKIFLFKGDKYFVITSKKDALKALNSDKSEIKKFLSTQKIKFKKNPEYGLVAIASYYDQLKK